MVKRRISKDAWIDAIKKSGGVISEIAASLGINRTTVFRYRKKYAWIDKLINEQTEVVLDMAESHVNTAVASGDMKSVRWYLDRKGRGRGYGPQIKLDGSLDQTGQVHVFLPDNGRDNPVDDTESESSNELDGNGDGESDSEEDRDPT